METVLFFWILFSLAIAIGAASRGRSWLAWGVLAFLISPLLALIVLAILPDLKAKAARGELAPTPETHVKCPDCRELVRIDARVCKHCRCRLVPQGEAA